MYMQVVYIRDTEHHMTQPGTRTLQLEISSGVEYLMTANLLHPGQNKPSGGPSAHS